MKYLITILTFHAFCLSVQGAENLSLQQEYGAKQYAPPHAKATLRLPASVMIGEEIPAALVITNTGKQVFEIATGGDYRSTGYPQRMKVRAQDSALQTLPELPSEAYGYGGGGFGMTKSIQPGQSEEIEFPLDCYVSFTKSGCYTITASHDLGWIIDKAHPHPDGVATLTVNEPTEEKATAYVKSLFDHQPPLSDDSTENFGQELRMEKQLCVLRHSAYLRALEERAKMGSKAAVMGIGHIASPQATEVLLTLLDHPSPEIVVVAANQICRRLPSRESPSKLALPYDRSSRYQIDPLLPVSWDTQFEKPLLDAALKMLEHRDIDVIEMAGFLLQARGEVQHAPAILAALQKSLKIYREPRHGEKVNTLDPPRPQTALMNALDVLRQQGWRTEGGDYAHQVAWFRQIADKTIPKPLNDTWQRSMLIGIEHGPATVRISALKAIPEPMPDDYERPVLKALEDPDWGVLRVACEVAGKSKRPIFARPLVQILEIAHENFLQYAAHDAAVACGARWDLWQAWISLIPYQDHMCHAVRTLIDGTVELPAASNSSGNSNFNRDQRFAIRNAWRDFLQKHQQQLSSGKRIQEIDPATIAALTGLDFSPDSPVVEIRFKDDTFWPPKPQKPLKQQN